MTARIPAIAQIADENVRKWIQANRVRDQQLPAELHKRIGPYITISRETGVGGSEIASKAAEMLGWNILDREIIEYLSEHYGTPQSLVEWLDEKKSNWLSEVLATWIEGLNFTSAAYIHRLNELFLIAATHGKVVIVGRGARFFLPRDRGLSVRIVAPLEYRVNQIQVQRSISEREARQFITDTEHQREAFVKEHYHKNVADPHFYDLVVNVEQIGEQSAARLISDAAESWMKNWPAMR